MEFCLTSRRECQPNGEYEIKTETKHPNISPMFPERARPQLKHETAASLFPCAKRLGGGNHNSSIMNVSDSHLFGPLLFLDRGEQAVPTMDRMNTTIYRSVSVREKSTTAAALGNFLVLGKTQKCYK